MLDKNGREIKVGDVVKRDADPSHHLPVDRMRVLRLVGDRNIQTDFQTNKSLPPIYLASLCEVIGQEPPPCTPAR